MLLKIVLRYLIMFYLMTVLSVSGHELFHYAAAKLLRFSKVFLCIGFENVCGIRTKHFFLSPLAFTGFVEYEESGQKAYPVHHLFLFYFSGILFNLILTAAAVFLHNYILLFINIIIIAVSLLPFGGAQSDLYHFRQLCSKERKKSL